MENPEKFKAPLPEEPEKSSETEKAEVEFMGWRETMRRRISNNKVLGNKDYDKYLNEIDPQSLETEDMDWDKKIRGKNFDPEEFKKYQMEIIELGKKDPENPRVSFMRHLTNLAQEEMKMKEFRRRFGGK